MNTLPTKREWGCILLLCKEVVDNLEQHLTKLEIPYMPINGSYFCHIDQFEKIPPSRLFEVDFIIEEKNYEKVIDSLDDLENCSKVLDSEYKSIFSYRIGKSDIRVDIYRKINCPGDYEIKAEQIFKRGLRENTSYAVLPSTEDATLLLFCKTFQNISLFFDKALFAKIDLIRSASEFSWEKLWAYAREYRVEKFATYLLLIYERDRKIHISIPERYFYSLLLSTMIFQTVYIITPQLKKKLFFKLPFVKNPIKYLLIKSYTIPKRKLINIIKNGFSNVMEKIAKPVIITAENTAFQNFSFSALENAKEYKLTTNFNERFIISTTTGLWILKDDTVKKITIGSSYGITRIGKRWYASQRVGRFSRIISFRFDLSKSQPVMRDIHIEHTGLPLNIHQIDSYNKKLFIIDTLKNRILYSNRKRKIKRIYPNKLMKSNYPADKNNHFNSVYITNEYIYVLAHNSWLKPPKPSQIYVLHISNYKNYKIIETTAQEAHNIVLFNNELVYCDSKGGKLIWGNSCIFTDKKHFLRGLALTKDMIVVGGSQIIERDKRAFSDSVIWFLDYKGNVKRSIELKKIGQINEIRAIDFDYGLSESWKNEQ